MVAVDGGYKVACWETKADGLTIIGNETIPVALRKYKQSTKKRNNGERDETV